MILRFAFTRLTQSKATLSSIAFLFSCAAFTTPARSLDSKSEQTDAPISRSVAKAHADKDEAAQSPRERRAQAYAKLLEGQRHLAAARAGSITLDALRQAQQAFTRASELDPTLSEAHTALAEIAFFFLNDLGVAEREARTAVKINPDNFGAHRILSRVYVLNSNLAEGKPDKENAEKAVAELREVARLMPSDAEAWAILGELHMAAGRETEAVEAFKRWTGAPLPIDSRFYQIVTKGKELTPATAQTRLAETLLRLNRYEEALKAARIAWALEPENARNLELLQFISGQSAQAYSAEGRVRDAVEIYEELLRARGITNEPVKGQKEAQIAAQALGGIALVQRQSGNLKEAAATIERMRRILGPQNPSPDIHAVDLLREQGKRQEALTSARAARLRYPENPRLLYLEATLLAELGRVQEAVSLYRPRLKGTAEDFSNHLTVASILINAGHGKEAVESAEKALALVPAGEDELNAQALLVLSSAQERAGDFKGAEESLRRVLSKDPDNAVALNNLGYYLAERNERLNEALEMIQRAVRSEPQNASFLDSLGWVYFKLGKLEDSFKYLSQAASRSPNSAEIQEHLGDVLSRLGKLEDARAAWRKALTLSGNSPGASRLKAKLEGESK